MQQNVIVIVLEVAVGKTKHIEIVSGKGCVTWS